jgi:hypothetical protein
MLGAEESDIADVVRTMDLPTSVVRNEETVMIWTETS